MSRSLESWRWLREKVPNAAFAWAVWCFRRLGLSAPAAPRTRRRRRLKQRGPAAAQKNPAAPKAGLCNDLTFEWAQVVRVVH